MIKAEYIWIDGSSPTPQVRSKTRIIRERKHTEWWPGPNHKPVDIGKLSPPVWGFDGSSTNQAEGSSSDCVLKPVKVYEDPIRGVGNILVLCEVCNVDGTPHRSNMRHELVRTADEYKQDKMWFGIEQEYTLTDLTRQPHGFKKGMRRSNDLRLVAQGPYYCGNGTGLAVSRDMVEHHLDLCLKAGIKMSGINAEVMPGQWEYQVGPLDPVAVADDLWISRFLLHRVSEMYGLVVSLEGKPAEGDWNGAGCHTNFSTKEMRGSFDACEKAAQALGEQHELHIKNYGDGIKDRLTGAHETCSHEEFRYGVSDRGASVRIPWQVEKDGKGYVEDRRPNANCDPYVVTRLITETVCGG
jgi:glutamine synthetase